MPFLSAQRYLALVKEPATARGTSVNPATVPIPVTGNPTFTPMVNWIKDEGLRGSPTQEYGMVPGYRHDEYSFKGNVHLDSFPNLVNGVLGYSTVASTSAALNPSTPFVAIPNLGSGTGVTITFAASPLTAGFSATGGSFVLATNGSPSVPYEGTYLTATATTLTGCTLRPGSNSGAAVTPTASYGVTVGGGSYTHTIALLNQASALGASTAVTGTPVALPVSPTTGVALPATGVSTTGLNFAASNGSFAIVHGGATFYGTYTSATAGTGLTGAVLNAGQTGFTPTVGDLIYPYNGFQGSQPASYTGYDVDTAMQGLNSAKQFDGAMFTDLDIEFSADGAMTYSSKTLSNAFVEVSTTTLGSQTWPTTVFVPAWNAGVTIAGASSAVVMNGSLSIKRNVQPIYTIGSQSPYRLWAGPIQVSGKLSFVVEANDTWMSQGLSTNTFAMLLTFMDPTTDQSITFQMSKVQLSNPKIESSKAWLELTADFNALGNGTDQISTGGNGGGFAPIRVIVNNATSSAY